MLIEKKFNFVFITTNLINGKQYVGDHSTDDLECSKTKNYLGSGRPHFYNAKKKYDLSNFKREILEFFPTKLEAFNAQEKYIKEYDTLAPNGYNISPKGGHNVNGCWSEESKQKLSVSKKGKSLSNKGKPLSEEHKQNLKGKNIGKKHTLEQNLFHNEQIRGKKLGKQTEEHRKKISEGNKGKHKISEETRKKLSDSHKGKKASKKTKQKMSKSHKIIT